MRDSPSTDEITKTLSIAGGEDSLDTAVSLIQILWESEYKNWEQIVADIEVCMFFKGKGPRNLPQNQRLIVLISFGLRPELSREDLRVMPKPICLLSMNNTGSGRSTHSWVLSWYSRSALKTRSRSSSILNMIPLLVFADIAKAYPSVPRPELMEVF